ncbi:hypothetical protein E1B06_14945 [Brevibacillus laterosporus]|uniref:hypothetical protein n=1 Tax=Brevibacillus laterosporus TaxID=1465 RepID=UPI0024070111|nr:hypothetical protein [Brevibacillus laterosporus]MDF9412980.1 hypothetical protein [Brevibacillus laterosporus]
MKKVIFSLLTLALVTSISSSALATEKIEATEVNTLAAIFYDREPNDSPEQANPYMIGGQINGELTWNEDADVSDNEDWYTFTPTRSGKVSLVFAYSKGVKNTFGARLYSEGKGGPDRLKGVVTIDPGKVLQFNVESGKKYYIFVHRVDRNPDARHDYNVYTEYIN